MYYPSYNIGIEEEYQLVDPVSHELLGYVTQSMAREQMVVNERTPNVELADRILSGSIMVGTPVSEDISQARDHLLRVRNQMLEVAHQAGVRVVGAGTHPFSRWEGREETLAQYRQFADDAQMIARRLLAFGLRIHIGVEDRDLAVDVMNTMRYVLPHIFCLSTSSPFWVGATQASRVTGLCSSIRSPAPVFPVTSPATTTIGAMWIPCCAPTRFLMRGGSCLISCRTTASRPW
ncbi:MAG: hypothetical protein IPK16_14065 [Anaerolineales bacterium]|nr:hypothetical protein [Anaerolineales bacterium]